MFEADAVVVDVEYLIRSALERVSGSGWGAAVPINQNTLASVDILTGRRVASCRGSECALVDVVDGVTDQLLETSSTVCEICGNLIRWRVDVSKVGAVQGARIKCRDDEFQRVSEGCKHDFVGR